MSTSAEAAYRLRLAQGFLNEARQDLTLGRWRAAVDNSQLCAENAAKAALALVGPVGRTHNPALGLRQALEAGRFSSEHEQQVKSLIECAELLGPDVHTKTDYGDESAGLTPWELFRAEDARQALEIAERACALAEQLVLGSGRTLASHLG
ncbi:MAG: HEPN domain-containing protein [Anaerolineae bacterium]|nr:HEPN domain-containing protein [Thermoflexales bacterium]MCX7938634.1 HEPN domain-containing protein [Thermoflexales bacterium]MDW8053712.1 HEPN domain-containing protein [Anaerolineae bacterium]